MEIIDAILTRRSIRRFTNQKISDENIETILKAGMYAPSANNQQSWHFVVVDNREILDNIPNIHPYAKMMKEATLAILVCTDLNLEKSPGYWVVDCSAATQNILLAAHGLGLGSVWLGVYPREERIKSVIEFFNLPENIKPLSLISIGYPAEEKSTPERFHKERIHWNKW